MKIIRFFLVVLFIFSTVLQAQSLDMVFLNRKYSALEEALRLAIKRQSIYAYDIANIGTPGFKLVLLPDDQKLLNELTIPDKTKQQEIILEFLMARMAENNKRYNAYLTLWKAKIDNNKRIVTLGK